MTIDTGTFVEDLGKPFTHPAVQALVKGLGLTKIPQAKAKEPDDYLEAKNLGIALAFTDGDYLAARKVPRYGNADMILTRVTLYAPEGEPGYKGFQGTLPGGLTLSDSPEQFVAKLGEPAQVYERSGVVRTRLWRTNGFLLSVAYASDGKPRYEQIILPAYFDRIP